MLSLDVIDEVSRVGVVPFYRISWSDESCLWAVSPLWAAHVEAAKFARPIALGSALSFDILAPGRGLDGISLHLASGPNGARVRLWSQLQNESGAVLASSVMPALDTTDGYCKILDLRDVRLDAGRPYRVKVSTSDAGSAVSTWAVAVETGRLQLLTSLMAFREDRHGIYREKEMSADSRIRSVLALAPRSNEYQFGAAYRTIATAFPNQQIEVVELDLAATYWPMLLKADVVLFAGVTAELDPTFDSLCFALHRHGICTIALNNMGLPSEDANRLIRYTGSLRRRVHRLGGAAERCHFTMDGELPPTLFSTMKNDPTEFIRSGTPDVLPALVQNVRRLHRPRVAVISVLYRKADIITLFLDHIVRQTYPGDIAVVLVDDKSPQNDIALAELYRAGLASRHITNRTIVTIENEANLGNCASRLAGMSACEADIYIVIDCDCLLNKDFVASHVFEHTWPDVDVVIGPLNIESGDCDPIEVVRELELFPERVAGRSEPQDSLQLDGFLNCITRNFSIKHRCLQAEPLFDLDFSYSQKPDSGFGWEDVEMGYRLYKRGAAIQFTPYAFSVHCTHDSSVDETTKIAGSMRNFERLFSKHPELAVIARRWSIGTYERLISWAEAIGFDGGSIQRSLTKRFAPEVAHRRCITPPVRGQGRLLRILSYRWHVPHQYELYKLPHAFTLATGSHNGMINSWGYDQRPLRSNVRMLPASMIDPRDFDLAILHFDESVLNPVLTNGVLPANWGDPFRSLLAIADLPKIAICHGTPQFYGQYALEPERKLRFDEYEDDRKSLVEMLSIAGVHIVCNSHQALAEWRFHRSRTIWHGFDPQEFPPALYRRDVLTLESDRHRPHYRGFWEQAEVASKLDSDIRIETAEHREPAIEIRQTNAFAVKNFRSYVNRIREFTAYLNTTLRSPMPRARGEAMMTGVIPVCLNNHDVSQFIECGVNGFYSDEPAELADFINYLCRNRDEARRIGEAARRTALDLFNHDRYLNAWARLITEVLN
jgi:glycosyltransferase involved in cell wall biosynthesis